MSRLILLFTLLLIFTNTTVKAQIESSRIVKVLSFNIYHGATMKGDFDLDYIADIITKTNPDLVALQEVDFLTNRAHDQDLATELGKRTKMLSLFGSAMPFDGGEYGIGLLSKWSFLSSRNVPLPSSEGHEPRTSAEIVTIIPSGDTIAFISTHFDHTRDPEERLIQARKINQVYTQNNYPTLLAGDLNAVPNSTVINLLEEFWGSSYNKANPAPTSPSNDPRRKIDYVMYYPTNRWKVINSKVIQDRIASDHCAYLVTLELLN